MSLNIVFGILLPFIGTSLGAAAVFFTRKKQTGKKGSSLSGFAAGVMVAASVFSLIIPAVDLSAHLGLFSFLPMLCGLWFGIVFLVITEKALSGLIQKDDCSEFMFLLAVVLHNIPEGMAVGVAFSLALATNSLAAFLSALMLSVGISLQNIPEGAIISLPLHNGGASKRKAFVLGSLSGIVEPFSAILALAFSSAVSFILPYLLGFAAGAMLFVSADELLPKAKGLSGSIMFCLGFSVMAVLDIALG